MNDESVWLSFSLTPVQGFIEASRTVRDLSVSSRIISHLVFAALEASKGDRMFPGKTATEEAIPNQFVVSFPSETEAELGARAALQACRDAWRKMAAAVHAKVETLVGSTTRWDDDWQEQVDGYWDARALLLRADEATLEVHERLFGPSDNAANPFRQQWKALAAALAAQKQIRAFPSYTGRGRDKCTLITGLEQMGPGGLHSAQREFWQKRMHGLVAGKGARIGRADRLSAVGLIKRFAPAVYAPLMSFQETVPDTAEIATRAWQKLIADLPEWAAFKNAADALNNAIPDPESLGRLLLEDSLDVKAVLDGGGSAPPVADACIAACKTARGSLFKATGKIGIRKPPRYLAAIALDGDRMGRRLSGDYCLVGEYAPRFLTDLSDKLVAYNGVVAEIVRQHDGHLVYAGGDDVLAFVPLETSAACALELREAFPKLPGSKDSTTSAALTVFHYKQDLRDVLRQTRAAEHEAKELGRNACTILVIKRSGGPLRVTVDWPLVEQVHRLAELFRAGATDRWLSRLAQDGSALSDKTEEAQVSLLLRHYIQRMSSDTGKPEADAEPGAQQTPTRDALERHAQRAWTDLCTFLNTRHQELNEPVSRHPVRAGQKFSLLAFDRYLDLVGVAIFLARGEE